MLAASFLGTRYNVGLECIWYSKGPRYSEGLDMACEETLSFRTPRRRGPSTPLPRLTLKARLMRSLETQPSPAIGSDPMMQIVFQLCCWPDEWCVCVCVNLALAKGTSIWTHSHCETSFCMLAWCMLQCYTWGQEGSASPTSAAGGIRGRDKMQRQLLAFWSEYASSLMTLCRAVAYLCSCHYENSWQLVQSFDNSCRMPLETSWRPMLEGPSSELPLAWPELQDKQTWFQDSLASDFWSVEDQRKDSALHDFVWDFLVSRVFWCQSWKA